MIIDVKLNGNMQAKIDLSEPVILPENELKMNISSDIYTLSTLLFNAKNGDKRVKQKLFYGKEIDISELLFPGVIETEISLLEKGEIVKTWRIQDIFVKDLAPKYEVIPEFAEMKGAIKEIVKILKSNNMM